MEHTWVKYVCPLLTPLHFRGLLSVSGPGESRVTAEQLLERSKVEARPAGEHLKRLRKQAKSADGGEGIRLKGLSREERRRLLSGEAA